MKNRFTRLLAVFAVALGLAGICGFAAAAPAKTDPTLAINSSSADNSFLIYGENMEELSKSTTAGPLGQFVSRLLGQVPSDLRQTLAPETSFIRAWFEKESVTDVALAITQSKPLAAKDYALKLGADPAAGNASGLADGLSYIGEMDIETNNLKLLLALANRSDGAYILGATSVDKLNSMFAWNGASPEAHVQSPLKVFLNLTPEYLNSQAGSDIYKLPVRLESGLVPHTKAFLLRSWINVAELWADMVPNRAGGTPAAMVPSFGSGTAAVLSMENAWIPSDLKLEEFKIPEETKKEIQDTLDSMAEFGVTWQNIVDVLRGAISVSISKDTVQSMFGPAPAFCVSVSGLNAELFQTLLPMAKELAQSQLGLQVKDYASGEWKGLQTGDGSPLSVWLAYGPSGLVVADVDPATLTFSTKTNGASVFDVLKANTPDAAAPAADALIPALLGSPHTFVLAARSDALAQLLSACGTSLQALGVSADELEPINQALSMVEHVSMTTDDGITDVEVTPTDAGLEMLLQTF